MSEIFKVGEIAELQNMPHPFQHINGEEVEILEGLMPRSMVKVTGNVELELCYLIDFMGQRFHRGLPLGIQPQYLKKRKGYEVSEEDRNAVASWEKVGWNPHKEVA